MPLEMLKEHKQGDHHQFSVVNAAGAAAIQKSGTVDQVTVATAHGSERMMTARGWRLTSCCLSSQLLKPKHPLLPGDDGMTWSIQVF